MIQRDLADRLQVAFEHRIRDRRPKTFFRQIGEIGADGIRAVWR